jgi:NADH:ubiquinone reductase (H+-translocating)
MQRPSRWIGGDLREDPAASTGRLAWLVSGMAHIYFLIGFRNRMAVATDWLWSYLTYQRGARLITGHDM